MRIDVHSGAKRPLRKECEGQGEAGHKKVRLAHTCLEGMQAQGRVVREQSMEGVFETQKGRGNIQREQPAAL